MTGYIGKTSKRNEDLIEIIARDQVEKLMGEMAGEIVSFNTENQTAEIRLLYTPRAGQLPNLLDVPVRFERCAKGGLTYPVQAGDKVNLRPQMRSTESYHTTGEHKANDTRVMSINDMEAYIDGGESLTDPIESFDADNVNLRFIDSGKFGLKGSPDGKLKIELNQGDLIDLLAELCEVLGTNMTQVVGGSSAGTHAHTQAQKINELAARLRAMVLT